MSQWIGWGIVVLCWVFTLICIFWIEYTRLRGLGLDGRPEVVEKVEKKESPIEKKETVTSGEKS